MRPRLSGTTVLALCPTRCRLALRARNQTDESAGGKAAVQLFRTSGTTAGPAQATAHPNRKGMRKPLEPIPGKGIDWIPMLSPTPAKTKSAHHIQRMVLTTPRRVSGERNATIGGVLPAVRAGLRPAERVSRTEKATTIAAAAGDREESNPARDGTRAPNQSNRGLTNGHPARTPAVAASSEIAASWRITTPVTLRGSTPASCHSAYDRRCSLTVSWATEVMTTTVVTVVRAAGVAANPTIPSKSFALI